MIVKIVDNRASREKSEDLPTWISAEQHIFPNVADIVYRHHMIDKKTIFNDEPFDSVMESIRESAVMAFLTEGNNGFFDRAETPIKDGRKRYLDWMYFCMTQKDSNGKVILSENFITDMDVYLMNDKGETIERYRTYHK